jgi:beta-glucanase (GH16 family)
VSGTVATGDVLLTTNGTWSGSPTSYSYQWQDCAGDGTGCTNIAGATSSTYTVASADTGHTIEALVTATNANGSATAGAPIVPLIDNFSGSSVDTNVWSVLNQQGDTSNDEQECYEPSQVSEGSSGLTIANVFNATGFVCPAGTPSSSACTGACSSSTKHYLSGAVQEINTAFTYGTVVFRARMLGHAGSTWPAVWLLGAACQTSHTAPYTWLSGTSNTALGYFCPWAYDSSDAAEVDIAEGDSGTTSTVLENVFNGNTNHACSSPTISDYSQNFHTYELDWSPGSLVFKIDGKATSCGITGSGVPSHPMFLIINAADQRSPSTGDFPNTMTVSYMHVSH